MRNEKKVQIIYFIALCWPIGGILPDYLKKKIYIFFFNESLKCIKLRNICLEFMEGSKSIFCNI